MNTFKNPDHIVLNKHLILAGLCFTSSAIHVTTAIFMNKPAESKLLDLMISVSSLRLGLDQLKEYHKNKIAETEAKGY